MSKDIYTAVIQGNTVINLLVDQLLIFEESGDIRSEIITKLTTDNSINESDNKKLNISLLEIIETYLSYAEEHGQGIIHPEFVYSIFNLALKLEDEKVVSFMSERGLIPGLELNNTFIDENRKKEKEFLEKQIKDGIIKVESIYSDIHQPTGLKILEKHKKDFWNNLRELKKSRRNSTFNKVCSTYFEYLSNIESVEKKDWFTIDSPRTYNYLCSDFEAIKLLFERGIFYIINNEDLQKKEFPQIYEDVNKLLNDTSLEERIGYAAKAGNCHTLNLIKMECKDNTQSFIQAYKKSEKVFIKAIEKILASGDMSLIKNNLEHSMLKKIRITGESELKLFRKSSIFGPILNLLYKLLNYDNKYETCAKLISGEIYTPDSTPSEDKSLTQDLQKS